MTRDITLVVKMLPFHVPLPKGSQVGMMTHADIMRRYPDELPEERAMSDMALKVFKQAIVEAAKELHYAGAPISGGYISIRVRDHIRPRWGNPKPVIGALRQALESAKLVLPETGTKFAFMIDEDIDLNVTVIRLLSEQKDTKE